MLVLEFNATSRLFFEHLSGFTNMVDAIIDSVSEDQEKQTIEYIDSTHDYLDRAQAMAIELHSKRVSARENATQIVPLLVFIKEKCAAAPFEQMSTINHWQSCKNLIT